MTLSTIRYIILGSGAFAREVYWHILGTFNDNKVEIIFVDPFTSENHIQFSSNEKIPIINNWKIPHEFLEPPFFQGFIIGIGAPKLKKEIVQLAQEYSIKPAKTIIHPKALVQDPECKIGFGGVICPGVIITTNVTIEDHVILNLNCTVGHDVIIKNFVTCNPGCQISGGVLLEEGVTLGTGTALRENIQIAENVVVGGQSFVSKNVDEKNITIVGVPAKKL